MLGCKPITAWLPHFCLVTALLPGYRTFAWLTGDTRKIFVSKTVDESNSARVLLGCKPIVAWLPHFCLVTALLPGYRTTAWLLHFCLVTALLPGYRTTAWLPHYCLVTALLALPGYRTSAWLTGDTRKLFVSKTVDESNSARVLLGCKPITAWLPHFCLVTALLPGYRTTAWLPHYCLVTTLLALPGYRTSAWLTGDTRKLFVSKTVDESNSARVLLGCKPITAWLPHFCLVTALLPGYRTSAWLPHYCLVTALLPGYRTTA